MFKKWYRYLFHIIPTPLSNFTLTTTPKHSFVGLSKCNINYEYPRLIIPPLNFHLADHLPFYQHLQTRIQKHTHTEQQLDSFCSTTLINTATASSLGQLIYTHRNQNVGRE